MICRIEGFTLVLMCLINFLLFLITACEGWHHRIMEPQDNSVWKRPQEVSGPISCSHRVRYEFRPGCSGLVHSGIENIKDIEHSTSLGSLCHCFILFIGRKFFITFSLSFPSFSLCPQPFSLPPHTSVSSQIHPLDKGFGQDCC